ncbi:MAG: ribonuclease HII [Pseudomonadota bacterium]
MGPDYSFEQTQIANGNRLVAGVDEVGRGPLAGPVVAAAVILDAQNIPDGLNDSKKLSRKRREILFEQITATARYAVAEASVAEIDHLNIYHASHLAICRAVTALGAVDHALVDGNKVPLELSCPGSALVKGDGRSVSIAAASILAKVTRDRLMVDLAQQHPGYDWDRNMGYPTQRHISALVEHGVTPHHRVSFRPVHNILYQA